MNKVLFFLTAAALLVSCTKEDAGVPGGNGDGNTPPFDFSTIENPVLNVAYDVPEGYQVYFEVYAENPLKTDDKGFVSLRDDVKPLSKGFTDASGKYGESIVLPSWVEDVYVYSPYIGVPQLLTGKVTGGAVTVTEPEEETGEQGVSRFAKAPACSIPGAVLLGGWDKLGRPDYIAGDEEMKYTGKHISRLNRVFNEGKPVSKIYFSASDIHVTEPANVTLCFVAEKAAAQNVLGYYCYPTGRKPASPADIAAPVFVFPRIKTNALKRGQAVRLKYFDENGVDRGYDFPAGVSIGWVLYHNGWNPKTGGIWTGEAAFYGDPDLNTAEPAEEKNHVALFKLDDMIFLGFEDWYNAWGDGDCNDVIFQVKANPLRAIDTDIPEVPDTDPDPADEAYFIDYEGTLAFEDNWPSYGDYDMNDVVVHYKATTYYTRNNEAVRTEDVFRLLWTGAVYRNGFGYETSCSRSDVEMTGDGTLEASGSKAVVLLFDDALTATADNTVQPEYRVGLKFRNPIPWKNYVPAPYNPFVLSRSERNHEIHLPYYAPTEKMNTALLGTEKDQSDAGKGIYYVSDKAYPFAIHITGDAPYVIPTEMTSIDKFYPGFLPWVNSGGTKNKDWYMHPVAQD